MFCLSREWSPIKQLIRIRIESTIHYKRYLNLRWSNFTVAESKQYKKLRLTAIPIEITKNAQNGYKKAKKYRSFPHSDSDIDNVVQELINKNSCDNSSVDASQPTEIETAKPNNVKKKKTKKFKKYRKFLNFDSDDSRERGKFHNDSVEYKRLWRYCARSRKFVTGNWERRKNHSLFLNRKETGETKETAIEVETANVSIDDDIWIMAIKKNQGYVVTTRIIN